MSDARSHSSPASNPRHRVLGALDRMAFRFFGPPERVPAPTGPVVHRHDEVEKEIQGQLDDVSVETDEEGRHYGLQRHEFGPVEGMQGNTYPYYSGRPPLNAPET